MRLRDGTDLAAPGAMADLQRHALMCYPEECMGYLDRDGRYVPVANVSDRPDLSGLADPVVLEAAMRRGDLRALCHSHPGGPDCPSEQDMLYQIEVEVPFVIVSTNGQVCSAPFAWGDQLLDERDLVGRGFRHGVDDCYALIRAHRFRTRGELLPDYARNWEWWLDGTPGEKDLYRRFFADAGFYEIDPAQVRDGDCWMAAVRSAVPNHAGVYLDGGLALHHPSSGLAYDPSRLSKREPVARWGQYITHWVRRD